MKEKENAVIIEGKKCESEMNVSETVKEVAKEAPKETSVLVAPDYTGVCLSSRIL